MIADDPRIIQGRNLIVLPMFIFPEQIEHRQKNIVYPFAIGDKIGRYKNGQERHDGKNGKLDPGKMPHLLARKQNDESELTDLGRRQTGQKTVSPRKLKAPKKQEKDDRIAYQDEQRK